MYMKRSLISLLLLLQTVYVFGRVSTPPLPDGGTIDTPGKNASSYPTKVYTPKQTFQNASLDNYMDVVSNTSKEINTPSKQSLSGNDTKTTTSSLKSTVVTKATAKTGKITMSTSKKNPTSKSMPKETTTAKPVESTSKRTTSKKTTATTKSAATSSATKASLTTKPATSQKVTTQGTTAAARNSTAPKTTGHKTTPKATTTRANTTSKTPPPKTTAPPTTTKTNGTTLPPTTGRPPSTTRQETTKLASNTTLLPVPTSSGKNMTTNPGTANSTITISPTKAASKMSSGGKVCLAIFVILILLVCVDLFLNFQYNIGVIHCLREKLATRSYSAGYSRFI